MALSVGGHHVQHIGQVNPDEVPLLPGQRMEITVERACPELEDIKLVVFGPEYSSNFTFIVICYAQVLLGDQSGKTLHRL